MSLRRRKPRYVRDGESLEAGFTILEIAVAIVILVVGLLALAGVLVTSTQQRGELAARRAVLARAESLLEEIKGVTPDSVASAYDGATYTVPGISGSGAGGTALAVSVDSTTPGLLVVAVTGSWTVHGRSQSLALRTEIYDPGP